MCSMWRTRYAACVELGWNQPFISCIQFYVLYFIFICDKPEMEKLMLGNKLNLIGSATCKFSPRKMKQLRKGTAKMVFLGIS